MDSTQEYEVNVIKLKLEDAGIPCWVINKKDSSYLNFGHIELYINAVDREKAKDLLAT